MDFSSEYIKMCEKAVEIQRYEFNDGDFYCERELEDTNYIFCIGVEYSDLNKGKNGIWWADTNGYCEGGTASFKNLIWLPRIDQLQEMITVSPIYTHLVKGVYFNCCESEGYWDSFDTMEKFWLNYVMEQKHNKTWNGEDWV